MIEIDEKRLVIDGLLEIFRRIEIAESLAYITLRLLDGDATEADKDKAYKLVDQLLPQ